MAFLERQAQKGKDNHPYIAVESNTHRVVLQENGWPVLIVHGLMLIAAYFILKYTIWPFLIVWGLFEAVICLVPWWQRFEFDFAGGTVHHQAKYVPTVNYTHRRHYALSTVKDFRVKECVSEENGTSYKAIMNLRNGKSVDLTSLMISHPTQLKPLVDDLNRHLANAIGSAEIPRTGIVEVGKDARDPFAPDPETFKGMF